MHILLLLLSAIAISSIPSSSSSSTFLPQTEGEDQLLMVFEVSRHGARTGLHLDYFNMSWIPGELTGTGMR